MKDYKTELSELIENLIARKGSDLHFSTDTSPIVRIKRKMSIMTGHPKLTADDILGFAKVMATEDNFNSLKEKKELSFNYIHEHNTKKFNLRVTVFVEKNGIGVSIRLVPSLDKNIRELKLPEILSSIINIPQGLFLIVGPTGHGKSTTMAAMVEEINQTKTKHIITVEDPIEFLFKNDKSIITQREIPRDSNSFVDALNNALRADVDIIMVGEMRNVNTMQSVITAAEVGHLAISTVHANSASQTIHRIIDSFPSSQQNQVRQQLAQTLIGVFSIRLIEGISGDLVPAYELMLNNTAVSNLIRENRIHSIDAIIQTSSEIGMISLDRSLANLVRSNEISLQNAQNYARDLEDINRLL